MRITTTVTINVSPENEPLVTIVVAKNGGAMPGESTADAITRIRNAASRQLAFDQIAPHVRGYFGEKEAATAKALEDALLGDAVEVSTEVYED